MIKKKEKTKRSIGYLLGILGVIIFIIFYFLALSIRSIYSLIIGLLLMYGLSIAGLIFSIKDRNNKKLYLLGIIINAIILIFPVIILIMKNMFIAPIIPETNHCFRAIGQIYIDKESQYTCYRTVDPDATITGDEYSLLSLTVKRGAEKLEVISFTIIVTGNGESESFYIEEGLVDENSNYTMLEGSRQITIPSRREMATYSIKTSINEVQYVEIAPVLKGNYVCDQVDRKEIEPC